MNLRSHTASHLQRLREGGGSAIRRGQAGLSLVELLVAFTVATIVVGAVLSVTLSSRKSFVADQHRTALNQNLRGALDLIGIEIRQAGERLPADFRAIEIIDGSGGAADTLILRRNLVDAVMPICGQLDAGSVDTVVRIADSGGSPPQGCAPLADEDADGLPDNLGSWSASRISVGGQLWSYVFNPVTKDGEWLLYGGDDGNSDYIDRSDGAARIHDYLVTQQCRAYVLEQRAYSLDDEGILGFLFNADDATRVNLSALIDDFQVRAILEDGTVLDAFDADDDWSRLRAIEITVAARSEFDGRVIDRSISSRFFPRNVLSN